MRNIFHSVLSGKNGIYVWGVVLGVVLAVIYAGLGTRVFVLAVSIVVVALVIKGMLAGVGPQVLILSGGLILLLIAVFLPPQNVDVRSGFVDVFVSVRNIFSSNLSGLGLTILVIDGFSRYMYEIGASRKLVVIMARPLRAIKSKYVLLGCCFILIQMIALFIPSPSGLSLLLMYTLYPVLRSLGCSKGSVAAIIASICINYGPVEVGTILIAELTGQGGMELFLNSQLPVVAIVFVCIGIMHMVMQRYWDKKEQATDITEDKYLLSDGDILVKNAPLYYALFPVAPLFILFVFSGMGLESPVNARFNMDIVSAILLSFFVALFTDFIRSADIRVTTQKVNVFFEQMGKSLVSIVSLLICAQVLAEGLIRIGFISTLFEFISSGGKTSVLILFFFSLLIFSSAVILGSSTIFNAFAPLAAEVATGAGASMIKILMSMYYSAGFGRAFSPIAGFIIIVSRMTGLTPYEIIKRNAVQLIAGYLLTVVLNGMLVS